MVNNLVGNLGMDLYKLASAKYLLGREYAGEIHDHLVEGCTAMEGSLGFMNKNVGLCYMFLQHIYQVTGNSHTLLSLTSSYHKRQIIS